MHIEGPVQECIGRPREFDSGAVDMLKHHSWKRRYLTVVQEPVNARILNSFDTKPEVKDGEAPYNFPQAQHVLHYGTTIRAMKPSETEVNHDQVPLVFVISRPEIEDDIYFKAETKQVATQWIDTISSILNRPILSDATSDDEFISVPQKEEKRFFRSVRVRANSSSSSSNTAADDAAISSGGAVIGKVKRRNWELIHGYSFQGILTGHSMLLTQYLKAVADFLEATIPISTYRAHFRTVRNAVVGNAILHALKYENVIPPGKSKSGELIMKLLLQTRLISQTTKQQSSSSPSGSSNSTHSSSSLEKVEFKSRDMYRFARFPPTFFLMVLTVESGENLLSMDLNGKSDPYAVVEFGHQVFRTKVVKKNLNPVWNESFFLVMHPDIDSSSVLKIRVYDYDTFSVDNFLGQISISDPVLAATSGNANAAKAKSYQLDKNFDEKKKAKYRGSIRVSLHILQQEESGDDLNSPALLVDQFTGSNTIDDNLDSLSLRAPKSYRSATLDLNDCIRFFQAMIEKSPVSVDKSKCLIWSLHEAENVRSAWDIYATVRIDTDLVTTKTSTGTQSPQWEQQGIHVYHRRKIAGVSNNTSFLKSDFEEEDIGTKSSVVVVDLYDARAALHNNFIGSASLPFSSESRPQWYNLRNGEKEDGSRIRFSMRIFERSSVPESVFCDVAPQFPIACDYLIAPVLYDSLARRNAPITAINSISKCLDFPNFKRYLESLRLQLSREFEWRASAYTEIGIPKDETLLALEDENVVIRRIESEKLAKKKSSKKFLPILPAVALNKLTEHRACLALTEKALYIREGFSHGLHKQRNFQRIPLQGTNLQIHKGSSIRSLRWMSFTLSLTTLSNGKYIQVDRIVSFPHLIDSDRAFYKINTWTTMINEVFACYRILQRHSSFNETMVTPLMNCITVNSVRRFLTVLNMTPGETSENIDHAKTVLSFSFFEALEDQQRDAIFLSFMTYLQNVAEGVSSQRKLEDRVKDGSMSVFQLPTAIQKSMIATFQSLAKESFESWVQVKRRKHASAEIDAITDLSDNIAFMKTVVDDFDHGIRSTIAEPIIDVLQWKRPVVTISLLVFLLICCWYQLMFRVFGVLIFVGILILLRLRIVRPKPLYRPTKQESKSIFKIFATIKEKKRQAIEQINSLINITCKVRALVTSENREATNRIILLLAVFGSVLVLVPVRYLGILAILKIFFTHFEGESKVLKYFLAFWEKAPVATFVDPMEAQEEFSERSSNNIR